MPKQINLRQIEAFKGVVENGTVSRAADLLAISQPAMSKLIAHLEQDTGLKLFARTKGRLVPTAHGLRLYDEIGRIFAGVKKLEGAVAAIKREEQGRLSVGVMPALSGSFVQRATMRFLGEGRKVFCQVYSLNSQWVTDWVVTRKLDVGLVNHMIDNPYVIREPLMEHPLVCIMPPGHPLAQKDVVRPRDLNGKSFIGFTEADASRVVNQMFEKYKVRPKITLVSNVAQTLCEVVAAGLGVSLVHPMQLSGFEHRIVARRFEPAIPFHYQLCYGADNRNAHLVKAFAQDVRAIADQISESIR